MIKNNTSPSPEARELPQRVYVPPKVPYVCFCKVSFCKAILLGISIHKKGTWSHQQRDAFRAPEASPGLCITLLRLTPRPYRVECTGSLSTSEVKQHRARLVLGWGSAWEDLRVLSAYFYLAGCSTPVPCLECADAVYISGGQPCGQDGRTRTRMYRPCIPNGRTPPRAHCNEAHAGHPDAQSDSAPSRAEQKGCHRPCRWWIPLPQIGRYIGGRTRAVLMIGSAPVLMLPI